MMTNFYKNICAGFINNEYQALRFNDEHIEDNIFNTFIKPANGKMYIINALDMDNTLKQPSEIIKPKAYEDMLENMSKKLNIKFVILNLYIQQNLDEYVREAAEADVIDFTAPSIELNWAAGADGELAVRGNQPEKLTDVNSIISSAYEKAVQNKTIAVQRVQKDKAVVHSAYFSLAIIMLNLLYFAVMELDGGIQSTSKLIAYGANVSSRVFVNGEYYRLLTSMFIHIGLMHLLSNCLAIYIMGVRVEAFFGRLNFLLIYFVSGIGASLCSAMLISGVSAGASGAVFGLEGAVFAYTLLKKSSMNGIDFFTIFAFVTLGIGIGFVTPNVDNIAHLGGLFIGFIMGVIMVKFNMRQKK